MASTGTAPMRCMAEGDDELVAVGQLEQQPVVAPDSEAEQGDGKAVDALPEVGVGQPRPLIDHRQLVGVPRGGAVEYVAVGQAQPPALGGVLFDGAAWVRVSPFAIVRVWHSCLRLRISARPAGNVLSAWRSFRTRSEEHTS